MLINILIEVCLFMDKITIFKKKTSKDVLYFQNVYTHKVFFSLFYDIHYYFLESFINKYGIFLARKITLALHCRSRTRRVLGSLSASCPRFEWQAESLKTVSSKMIYFHLNRLLNLIKYALCFAIAAKWFLQASNSLFNVPTASAGY